jgi:endonuclease YncB( thermonuclease family)
MEDVVSDPRTKSPAPAMIPLFVIGGLTSHLVIFVLLVAALSGIAGLDDGHPVASEAPTSSAAPTSTTAVPTTATPAPAPIMVESAVSGDSVVVSDGIRRTTVTISGMDAPDVTGTQCWSAESLAFTAAALVGKHVELGVATLTTAALTTTVRVVGAADFAVAAVTAGMARAAVTGATDAVMAAQASAGTAGAGLWGAPCMGGLDLPVDRPGVPAPPTQEPQPDPEPAQDAYYANCAEARAAGAAPIRRGEPGYRPALDRDDDGTACDS